MSEAKDAVLERLWLVGSGLAVLSLVLPYARLSGQVGGVQLFQNVPVSLFRMFDFVSNGPPDPAVALIYLILPPVLIGVGVSTLLGAVVSLRSQYWGGYILISSWVGFWIAAVFAINTVSIPGVSQLNVAFSAGFYALLLGSLLVFSHHVRSHEATQTRHERLSLVGGSLVFGSLLLPYLQLSGTLFGLTITVGFTLPGLAITLPGANLVAMAVVMGVFLIAGWLAMPPGVMYPGDIRLKSDIYPLASAALVFAGLGALILVTETLLGSLGVNISYQIGALVVAMGGVVLVGATVDKRRTTVEEGSPAEREDEVATDDTDAGVADEPTDPAGEIDPEFEETEQPVEAGGEAAVTAEAEATISHDSRRGEGDALEASAERLELPPKPEPVTEGIETMRSAIDAVVDETDADTAGVVDGQSDPVERATSVKRAADGGTLFESVTDTDDGATDTRDETVPTELKDAVGTVRTRAAPRTSEAQELLDALQLADDVSERHLTETLGAVVEKLNGQEEVAAALAEIDPGAKPREMARTLDRHSSDIDRPEGQGLATIADELRGAVNELEACQADRRQLADNAEAVCTAANDQTTVTFDSTADTDQWLAALTEHVNDGTISFTEQATDIGHIVSNVEGQVRPQSSLAKGVVEALRSDSINADERERAIADALAAIDSTETLRHRLEGVTPDEVERLARRLQGDLAELNAAGSSALADRVEELSQTAAQAGESDLMAVYAARQELRFYDQQLIDALGQTPTPSGDESPVASRYEEIERRRDRMRSEYPDSYPNHDHSIPIHFLELVEALQESADEARTSGNEQRAVGYLEAADLTLDWVAELYDRHSYNVLLEQLRG